MTEPSIQKYFENTPSLFDCIIGKNKVIACKLNSSQ